MDARRVKAAQLDLYEAGEYAALSATLRPVALELARRSGTSAGDLVLDVGAGDGNVAVAVAERGCRPVACDLSLVQLRRARGRRDDLAAVAGDAERLPFRGGAFDAVLSAFGAVFAPHPELMLSELFRVCRPGGTVALTAWPPDSFMGEATEAIRSHAPEPEAFPDQELGWGIPEVASERFAAYAEGVETHRLSFVYHMAVRRTAGEADFSARYYAERMAGIDLASLTGDILVRHGSEAGIVADYLLTVGRRR